ncbi:MAG TPA: DUF6084 family protein [Gemmataceae bacterium]|jgi:hypothetical protein
MPDLNFQVESVGTQRFAASPHLLFQLHITESVAAGEQPASIQSVLLRCQIRIEPARRRYTATEKDQLLDLFGTPDRWGQTLRPLLWTQVSVIVPQFFGNKTIDLPVPCSYDFSLAATKYFDAVEEGAIPLCFLFSGTVFYKGSDAALQVAQISWDKEASFRLSVATWREIMELYYPNCAWLCLRKDVFDALNQYRKQHGLPTWEQTLERLLPALEPVKP